MTLRTSLALCTLLLSLSACDSGSDDQALADNSFVLSVEGAGVTARTTTRSKAYSGSFVSDTQSQSFAILLGSDPDADGMSTADQPFLAFIREGGRPAVGSYAFPSVASLETEPASGTFVGLYVDPTQFTIPEEGADSFDLGGFYFTTGGTLTITESSSDRIVGTFTGMARGFDFFSGQFQGAPIRFEGRFSAVPSDDFQDGGLISGPAAATAQ